jgi:1-acyl-sn-glycerol-3-phosphate acyltransferase
MKRLLLRHTVLRRLVTIPTALLLLVVIGALTPVAVVISGLLALRPGGRGRVMRITLFAVVYLISETVGMIGAGWLWVRAGLGSRIGEPRVQQEHYNMLGAILRGLYAVGTTLFNVQITAVGAPHDDAAPALPPTPGRPLVVLSRHAGPGDSFLLAHALLTLAHRRPRIVLKDVLRLDPAIDLIISRLPHCFVSREPNGGEIATREIKQIAGTMGPADALLVFPEGGKFTPRRRLRVIASLRRKGLARATEQARRLQNVLPPQPAGVFTAIDAAPGAELVFLAHTGLDHIQSVRQTWQGIPLTHPVEVTWWTIPVERVPSDEDARLRWLAGNWAEIDAWISRTQPSV